MRLSDVRKIYENPIKESRNGMIAKSFVNGALTGKERKEIYLYWVKTKKKSQVIAKEFGRSRSTVDRIISSYNHS